MDEGLQSCCNGCSFQDTPFLSGACGAGFALFMGLVEYLIRGKCSISDSCRRFGVKDAPLTSANEYDYIVIGAGVAGPVIASRLTENPAWNVLLLEAGPEEPTLTSVPAFAMSGIGSAVDWNYKTEPGTLACLSTNGVCTWPRGKMISGSSGLQGMMYTRGHYSIIDSWGQNNPGWSYDDLLPYYIKSENNQNPDIMDDGYHGYSGPLVVQQFPSKPPLADEVVRAAEELGYWEQDLNGRNTTGAAVAQMMVHEGLRASTARMYLRPYIGTRNNLKVSINSHVTKILFDENKRAYGVQYLDKNGNTKTVKAKKEVILTAGAVASPQLLLLSGVGPKADLEALKIPVVHDLPGVGQNLHNHVAGSVAFTMEDPGTNTLTLEAVNEFLNSRTGALASTGLTQTTIFMKSKYVTDEIHDLQMFFNGFWAMCGKTGVDGECADGTIGNCSKRQIVARPTLVRPLSRGFLKLRSTDPLDPPLIYPNYLLEQHDVDVLVDGIKLAIDLSKTKTLQKYGFKLDDTYGSAACKDYQFGTDDYWECTIRMDTGPEHHQSGSCKMGPASDSLAVVDNHLKVHGLQNVRVADASIFPVVPNANPTSTIVALAEKLVDMMKQEIAQVENSYSKAQ